MEVRGLPRRRFFVAGSRWERDALIDRETGFLKDAAVRSTWSMGDLLERQAALVLGPPWMGKTYTAKKAHSYLREHATSAAQVGGVSERDARPSAGNDVEFSHAHLTDWTLCSVTSAIVPAWWENWRASNDRACWIVDALDEHRNRGRRANDILDAIEGLNDLQRARLTVVLFCRKSEQDETFVARLNGLYPGTADGAVGLLTVELAPLGEEDARGCLKDRTQFERIVGLIKANGLQSVAGLPAAIEAIEQLDGTLPISVRDVWERVLLNILDRGGRTPSSNVKDRFKAACRIAAVGSFTEERVFDRGYGVQAGPDASELFSDHRTESDRLRAAAKDALLSAVFDRGNGGFVIKEDHVRQWLAAFAIENLELRKVRRLLADDSDRAFAGHAGIRAALCQIECKPEVRAWIIERNGGVPPPFDAGPLTLSMAEACLDRMLEAARGPEHGISAWDLDFRVLDVPGIGGAIRARLGTPGRTFGEKQFLITAAMDLQATECVSIAARMVRDESEKDQARVDAAYLLCRVGTDAELRELEVFAREFEPRTREQLSIKMVLILGLVQSEVWSFRQAWEQWRRCIRGADDGITTLRFELKRRMNAADARWLLERWDWEEASRFSDGRRARRDCEWLEHAMDTIGAFSGDDFRLLWPLMFFEHAGRDYQSVIERAWSLLRSDVGARRELFEDAVRRDPGAKPRFRSHWQRVVQLDDAEWIAELARTKWPSATWLWRFVLCMAEEVGGDRRERLRGWVSASRQDVVGQFDADRQRAIEQEEEFEREKKAIERERPPQYKLEELVEGYLANQSASACAKMYALANVCVDEAHLMPDDVTGTWGELSEELRHRVVAQFSEALRKCTATTIPDSDSYPATVALEAIAFTYAMRNSPTYELDGKQIRKWLPCVVALGHSEPMAVVAKCHETDKAATEDVIFDELMRALRIGSNEPSVLHRLPESCWTESLAMRLAVKMSDEALHAAGRCRIVRLLARVAAASVEPIARGWVAIEPSATDAEREKRTAGIDALLRINVPAGLSELEREDDAALPAVVVKLGALVSELRRRNESLRDWPAVCLERLYAILERAFPARTDPKREPGSVWHPGPGEDLREIRWAILSWLFDRGGVDETAALERLAARYEEVGKWYAWKRGTAEAKGVVESVSGFASQRQRDAGYVLYEDVVRLLDDAEYRIIRGEEDLLDVAREQIESIAKTANKHLSMLYESARKKGQAPKRLHEKALQAYLHCRLMDLLPKRGVTYFANREPIMGEGELTDIKIEAETIEGGTACVIIEVKWSDNAEIATGFESQLITRYLQAGKGEEKAGLYFVGWCGTSKWPGLGKAGVEELREKLEEQVSKLRGRYAGLHLEVCVLDLQWR